MATEQVIGVNAFIEQAKKRTFSRQNGWATVRTWIGPKAKAEAKADELELDGAESIDVQEGVPAIITATYPDDAGDTRDEDNQAEANAIWEIQCSEMEKDLRTHGKFNKSISSAPVLALIDKELEQGIAIGASSYGSKDYDTLYADKGELNKYVALKGMGVESYLSFRWTVRKTVSSSRKSTLKWQNAYGPQNIPDGQIVEWSKILVPNNAKIVQPALYIFGGPTVDGSSNDWHFLPINAWMQKPATVTYEKSGRNRKYQLVREWIGAVTWSGTLYCGGTADP